VPEDFDDRFRAAAFAYLHGLIDRSGGLVTRSELEAFPFDGKRVRLIAPQQGIWTPKGLDAALTIMTTFAASPEQRPYADEVGPDGYQRYKWRGTDAEMSDNRRLRAAMKLGKPLVWLLGVAPGIYQPAYPVWLVAEESDQHQFVVALDEVERDGWTPELADRTPFDPLRRYAVVLARQRLHQRVFRGQVLVAYDRQCALCRLRHESLLDAAHIKEDSEGGKPVVPNGMAMCAIHHRAFDANVLGVRPDHVVEIRSAVLAEHDGPTLRHALQDLHGTTINLPRHRRDLPSTELLEERYQRFREAG
jgi:putative restriction endonuclease